MMDPDISEPNQAKAHLFHLLQGLLPYNGSMSIILARIRSLLYRTNAQKAIIRFSPDGVEYDRFWPVLLAMTMSDVK